jgi:predicted CXXCH cytochrome family protein
MGPSATVEVAPPVAVEHVFIGRVDEMTLAPTYTPVDAAMPDVQRFDMIRVRFQIRNEEDRTITIRPRLDVRPAAGGVFAAVPADGVAGAAFYVGPEWVSAGKAGGTTLGPSSEPIPLDAIRSHDASGPDQMPRPGIHSMGSNSVAPLRLPSRSYTEVEFTVRPTTDAQYLADYEFRITDEGTPFLEAATATLRMGARPSLLQSPVQLSGVPVGPATATSRALTYRLVQPEPTSAAASRFAGSVGGIHGPYGIAADQCASCHVAHTAQAPVSLVAAPPPQSSLCFRCHDSTGTGAATDVAIQYSDPLVPSDAPETGSYYRHDALAVASTHTLASADEFGGVSDRHDTCADCHNPHTATDAESTQSATGWTVPGQLTGVSGVSVENGSANSAPRYTLLDGANGKVALEYQLCLKCHSGWTVLPARDPLHPSWWAEDKGVELNPANDSYHPIEAPGTNTSTAMANSLAGTSPYKLWAFSTGSTVRCLNCHGDYRKFDTTSPPAAGSDLAPHASRYRGNLMQNYRDRDLKPFTEPYRSNDFALCYLCHAEAPFSDGSGSNRADTNFRYHGLHLTGIRNLGNLDGDIDTVDAGRGDAICAECHFRTHSNAFGGDFRTGTSQTGTRAGLVNFAPNVTSNVGFVDWTRTGTRTGSCTLTCHGYSHEDKSY